MNQQTKYVMSELVQKKPTITQEKRNNLQALRRVQTIAEEHVDEFPEKNRKIEKQIVAEWIKVQHIENNNHSDIPKIRNCKIK